MKRTFVVAGLFLTIFALQSLSAQNPPRQYVTSADANRFLFIEKVDPTNTAPIQIILNWPASLNQ